MWYPRNALDGRPYVLSGRNPRRPSIESSWAKALTKMAGFDLLHLDGCLGRTLFPFLSQIAAARRALITLATGAAVAVAWCAAGLAVEATDIRVTKGPELKEKAAQFSRTEDGGTAIRFFLERGNKPYSDGLAQIQ